MTKNRHITRGEYMRCLTQLSCLELHPLPARIRDTAYQTCLDFIDQQERTIAELQLEQSIIKEESK